MVRGVGKGLIQAHEDGPAYYPIVATVSLGSHIILNVFPKNDKSLQHRILQEPRSLLITTGEVYTSYLHSISEISLDENLSPSTILNWPFLSSPDLYEASIPRSVRTSLTYRDVLKTVNLRLKT
jgi:alkylated DNA repair protein alkB homolog 6